MKGYAHKRYRGFRCVIRDDLARIFSDAALYELCRELFSDTCKAELIKRGAYKTLLKTTINTTTCIVKKYRIPGLVRTLRGLVIPSRPRQ